MKLLDVNDNVIFDTTINKIEDFTLFKSLNESSLKIALNLKSKYNIEKNIYSNYSEKKQQQDEKWVSNYSTKLKALNVENLESKLVSKVTDFFDGKTLEETISDVPEEQKKYFEKLVKIGVRAEWLELSIEEGKKAIEENRDFSFRDFPKFK